MNTAKDTPANHDGDEPVDPFVNPDNVPTHLPRSTPPPEGERRELLRRAQAALPEDASDKDIAAKAIQMAKEERGVSWTELVDTGWTFGGDDVAALLGPRGR